MTDAAFYDVDAEECVVGAALVARSAIETVAPVLLPSDFGSPHLGAAFDAQLRLHRAGSPIDPTTVTDELRRTGSDWPEATADLIGWMANVPSTAAAGHYAEIVARHAVRRALRGVGTELLEAAADPTRDPSDIADETRGRLASLDSPALAGSPGDLLVDEFVDQDVEQAPAVIPGLLDEDHRVVIVAPEGVGKSELARQMIVCATHGIEPFTGRPSLLPVPALLVDLENPRALLRRRLGALTATARAQGRGVRAPAVLWHRPGGIDLRKRADRLAFEDVLRRNRPKLVALGPAYKSYVRTAHESDENVASEVQTVLDDLRTRFGFALILEHHAPQANAGVRDLRPFGSSLWLRWPETGIRLSPDRERPGSLIVGRWRGDRAVTQWPDALHRGDVWPWSGWWRDGVPAEPEEAF